MNNLRNTKIDLALFEEQGGSHFKPAQLHSLEHKQSWILSELSSWTDDFSFRCVNSSFDGCVLDVCVMAAHLGALLCGGRPSNRDLSSFRAPTIWF